MWSVSFVPWWMSNVMLGLLLYRAVRGRFARDYPLFYLYVAAVLVRELVSFYLYFADPGARQIFYWYTEFVLLALGCSIIWEVYGKVLGNYLGAWRIARHLLGIIYVLLSAWVLAATVGGSLSSLGRTTVVLQRNLRCIQALLVLGVVILVAYYTIPVGRNVKGILGGYGAFVGTNLVTLTLRDHLGRQFQLWWQLIDPMMYNIVLLVWCASLWSYQPNPTAEKAVQIEDDYEALARQTEKVMGKARDYLLSVVR